MHRLRRDDAKPPRGRPRPGDRRRAAALWWLRATVQAPALLCPSRQDEFGSKSPGERRETAAAGKGWAELVRRGVRTAWFMVVMVTSLLVASAPALVAAGDVAVALWLEVRLGCFSGHGLRGHLQRYRLRNSLADIPLVSVVRSIVITCVYLMSDTSGLSHGPYLGTTTFCSLASLLILLIKASVYSPAQVIGPELSPSLPDHKLNLKKLWGMPVLFLSSLGVCSWPCYCCLQNKLQGSTEASHSPH